MAKKNPQWWDKTLHVETTGAKALQDAAKVLREDVKEYRRDKNVDAALAVERVANALEQVAQGKTWTQAFKS